MPLHPRTLPAGFIAPCLPSSAPQAPSGEEWLHEIKHDGFRVIARKAGSRVKLYSRPGNDLTDRFPLIAEALAKLRSQSCIIDGEAVACGDDGISSFDRIRYRHHDASVFLYAFDLIELNGDDLRREPLAVRKATLASLLTRGSQGLRFNELDQEQEPERARREAGSRGGLGTVITSSMFERAPAVATQPEPTPVRSGVSLFPSQSGIPTKSKSYARAVSPAQQAQKYRTRLRIGQKP